MILIKPLKKLVMWPFILVVFTIVFGMVGLKVDSYMGTPPLFMTGFLILGFFMLIMRLYNQMIKELKK